MKALESESWSLEYHGLRNKGKLQLFLNIQDLLPLYNGCELPWWYACRWSCHQSHTLSNSDLADEFDDGADWLNGDHSLPAEFETMEKKLFVFAVWRGIGLRSHFLPGLLDDGTKQASQGLHLHPSKRLQPKVRPGYYLSNPSE